MISSTEGIVDLDEEDEEDFMVESADVRVDFNEVMFDCRRVERDWRL